MIAYDEEDNGFQFSRAKSKRTKAKAQTPPAEPAPAPVVDQSEANQSTTVKKKRKKYSFSDVKELDAPRMTRRSARLSGDKEQLGPSSAQPQQQPSSTQLEEPSKPANNAGVQRNAEWNTPQSRKPKKIALPFADTPIIRRNKEMRNKGSESSHRRSSTGMRGRRASSLIDSGASNGEQSDIERTAIRVVQKLTRGVSVTAVPHTDVELADFYKHIEQSLPEPRRMKQLLTWCGTRALPEKQSGDAGDGGALLAGMCT